jgi:integrase
MPRAINKLKDRQVKMAKNTTGKLQYLYDGDELRLKLQPNGSKIWYWQFYIGTKPNRKRLGVHLGHYPEMTLQAARDMKLEGKKLVAKGIHPRDYWDSLEEQNLQALDDRFTFGAAYESTMKELKQKLRDTSITRYAGIYNLYFKKPLQKKSLFTIDKKILRTTLMDIRNIKTKQDRGHNKTATIEQAVYLLNNIYKYAENIGFDKGNPTPTIKSLNLPPPPDKHHPFVHPDKAGEYWNKVKSLTNIQDKVFFKLNIITILRANTQSKLTWSMFDASKKRLVIPQELMKNDRGFITYLPDEIVDDLKELKKFKDKTNKDLDDKGYKPIYDTSDDAYIFNSNSKEEPFAAYNKSRPAKLIKTWGEHFADKTLHGNRSLFTIATQQGVPFNVPQETVKFQLSHAIGNKKTTAIEHYIGRISDWDGSRIKLVNWWCDYLNERENAFILSNKTIKKAQTSKAKKSN